VLRAELLKLAHACGVAHPGLLTLEHIELLDHGVPQNPWARFRYERGWSLPAEKDIRDVTELMDQSIPLAHG
ncbi:hypothetical protein, partial [Salmonella enterica]|uniref:hypothetical protein n=1 Tax=Salmonella enterica TaxID=28901 RepID=UPI003CEF8122